MGKTNRNNKNIELKIEDVSEAPKRFTNAFYFAFVKCNFIFLFFVYSFRFCYELKDKIPLIAMTTGKGMAELIRKKKGKGI